MNELVYIDPDLLKGEALRIVRFIKELENSWILQGALPKTNNIDKYEKITKENALQLYPELSELFDLDIERTCSFRKGMTSGKWYDFL